MSSGRTWVSEPLKARPIGVRMASTITASGMKRSPRGSVSALGARRVADRVDHVAVLDVGHARRVQVDGAVHGVDLREAVHVPELVEHLGGLALDYEGLAAHGHDHRHAWGRYRYGRSTSLPWGKAAWRSHASATRSSGSVSWSIARRPAAACS